MTQISNARYCILAALTCLLAQSGNAETLVDLKGHSIEAKWVSSAFVQHIPDQTYETLRIPHSLKIYVSSKGRIFQYAELGSGNSSATSATVISVTEIAQAVTLRENQMRAWDFLGGHLTQITKEPEGFRIITIAADLANLSCTISDQIQPDEKTGKYRGIGEIAKTERWIYSLKTTEEGCHVTKGNLFAQGQD